MTEDPPASGYTLVVCEKPDAARRVSEALAEEDLAVVSTGGIPSFSFRRKGERFVVCAAQGHLYGVSDPFAERSVYPVFDVGWFPQDQVEEGASTIARRISAIGALARGASKFVNACDYDAEGETIGFNILRYCCAGAERAALRVRFSTLTRDELVEAFETARFAPESALAASGRARHVVDFVWGVNLSRVLSLSTMMAGKKYRTVSVGRVQGPTLNFVVEKEVEIRTFVPRPYWTVRAHFENDGRRFGAGYSDERVRRRSQVQEIEDDCRGRDGRVESVTRRVFTQPPPPAFNTGDLQKEAFRHFRLSPTRTMQAAERLYLEALISYPRTSSQRLPPSINYGRILKAISETKEYSSAGDLLKGEPTPVQGGKEDSAHPAIYPTGERARKPLGYPEAGLYDMIVRRFIAAFAPPARKETASATIAVGSRRFGVAGRRTVAAGWLRYYGKYANPEEVAFPDLHEGDEVRLISVEHQEKFEPRPQRYNQGSLLEKMEAENLGTKATRAETISTLVARKYVEGDNLVASDLGLEVIGVMKRYAPSIVSTDLTRAVEGRLEKVEEGSEDGKSLIRDSVRSLCDQLAVLNSNRGEVGRILSSAALSTASSQGILGACPVCKTGKLKVIRSRKTHKRFVGCTNYAHGCRASAPLPQRGVVKPTNKACESCSWPVVYVRSGRYPWKLCVNANCPSKVGRKNAL